MFEGFAEEMVDLGDVRLHVRFGGDGPPVLLIHGHPRTSASWHRVAPRLAAMGFTVVCPDMGGPASRDSAMITVSRPNALWPMILLD